MKFNKDALQIIIKHVKDPIRPLLRHFHARSCSRYCAGDVGYGVCIGAESDGIADGLLVRIRLKTAANSLGTALRARIVLRACCPVLGYGLVEVITEVDLTIFIS